MARKDDFDPLLAFLERLPAIAKHGDEAAIAHGSFDDGRWWVKFALDIAHPLAWRVVQELGHVLNYLSIEDRLPTLFMPVSPPPYMNGGPGDFLSWVIESSDDEFRPASCAEFLENSLPRPVDKRANWKLDDKDDHTAPSRKRSKRPRR